MQSAGNEQTSFVNNIIRTNKDGDKGILRTDRVFRKVLIEIQNLVDVLNQTLSVYGQRNVLCHQNLFEISFDLFHQI